MSASYLTVAAEATAEIEVRRSRFLCRVVHVESEEAAREVVEQERRAHRDARHHCWAFVLGPGGEVARCSDAGEPSGTAGAPMLEVLRGAEVSDVVAVVTRWFGGVLLGAGGLVRAYGDAVREGLAAAGTTRRHEVAFWTVAVPLAEAGRVENELRSRGVAVRSTDYPPSGRDAVLHVAAAPAFDLAALLAAVTSGTVTPEAAGTGWSEQDPSAGP
ncbi:MAG: IMPACT family protein [Actinomycetes bacterium]